MDLDQLANLGEFVGGLAVLVTLAYLAVQVREGNRQTAASLQLDLMGVANEIAQSAQDPTHAALLVKLKDDAPLDRVEAEQADAYVFRTLNFWHAAQQAHLFGMMDPAQFGNVCADVERNVRLSPGFHRRAEAMLEHFPLAQQHEVFQPILAARR